MGEPNLSDVERLMRLAAEAAYSYLSTQVPMTEDGSPRVGLTGDEDAETIDRYQSIYQPLKKIAHAIFEFNDSIQRRTLEESPTGYSQRLDVLACTGEESDEAIAKIYRDGVRGY